MSSDYDEDYEEEWVTRLATIDAVKEALGESFVNLRGKIPANMAYNVYEACRIVDDDEQRNKLTKELLEIHWLGNLPLDYFSILLAPERNPRLCEKVLTEKGSYPQCRYY